MNINYYDYNEEVSYLPNLPKDYTVTISQDDKIINIDDEGNLIASVGLEFDAATRTLLLSGKDNEPLAEIELPNFIVSIDEFAYDKDEHEIVFHAKHMDDTDVQFSFTIEDLVDLYQAGDGISIDQETKTISIKIKEDSQDILGADEDGLSIDLGGLDNRLSDLEALVGEYQEGTSASTKTIVQSIQNLQDLVGEYQEGTSASTKTIVQSIQNLQDLVGEQSSSFQESLAEIVEKHDADILSLQDGLTANVEKVDELASIVGTQSEESGVLTERLADLEALVGEYQEDASASSQSLLERLDTLESTVGEQIEGVGTSLTQLVSDLESKVDANADTIESLGEKDTELLNAINQNTANIEIQSNNIEELKESLLDVFGKDYGTVNVNESMSLFANTQGSDVSDAFESLMTATYGEIQKVATQHTEDFNEFIAQSFVPLKESVDILKGDGEGSISKTVSAAIAKVVDNAPESLDTLKEIADYIESDHNGAAALANKVAQNESKLAEHEVAISNNAQVIESNKSDIEEKLSNESIEIRGLVETLRDNTSNAIADVIKSIEDAKDDIETSMGLLDEGLQATFTSQLNTAIDAEAQARLSKDDDLIGLINSESSRAQGEESRIEAKFDEVVDNMNLGQVGSDGSYLKLLSQTNGALSVTPMTFDTTLSKDSTNAPTSASVLAAIDSAKTTLDNKIESNASQIEDNAKNIQHLTSVIEDTYFNGIEEGSALGVVKDLLDRISVLENELALFKTEVASSISSTAEDVKAYADSVSNDAMASSKEFASAKAVEAESNAKSYAKSYVDDKSELIESSYISYVDGKISDVNATIDDVKVAYVTKLEAQDEHDEILASVASVYQIKGDYITKEESRSDDDAVKAHVEGLLMSSESGLTSYVDGKVAAHENAVNDVLNGYYTKSEVDGLIIAQINAEVERAEVNYEKKGVCVTMADVVAMNYVTSTELASKNYQTTDMVDAKVKVVSDKLASDYYDKRDVDSALMHIEDVYGGKFDVAAATYATKNEVYSHITDALATYLKSADAQTLYANKIDLLDVIGMANSNSGRIDDIANRVRILEQSTSLFSSIKDDDVTI